MRKLLTILFTIALLTLPALAAEEGEGLRVAVVDSGISSAVIAEERIAPGRSYIRPQDGTEDRLGHGTAVAAVIVGSEPARLGGLCPTAALVPLVYCSADEDGREVSGGSDMAAQAIRDAVDEYGCRIINVSSGSLTGSGALRDAADYAASRGVLVVASAGNHELTDPGAVYYPGGYESVLCVGACDAEGRAAPFSQENDTVDLLAPGTDLRLASLRGKRYRGEGTSFAAAYVTGVAAQLWTRHPDWTADAVRGALLAAARTVEGRPVLDAQALSVWSAVPAGTGGFSDVPSGAYYAEAAAWAAEQGVTAGMKDGTFRPGDACTRAQIVTFLWRAAGSPAPVGTGGFSDVPSGAYYAEAAAWAAEQGVTAGMKDGTFRPGDACTRAQIVTFLWRAAGSPAPAGTGGFSDVPSGAYYAEAAVWAAEQGVTAGMKDGTFRPGDACTRAQIVTFLYRLYVKA